MREPPVGNEAAAPSAGPTLVWQRNSETHYILSLCLIWKCTGSQEREWLTQAATSGSGRSHCCCFLPSLSQIPPRWGWQGLMRALMAHKVALSSSGHWRGEGVPCHPQLLIHIRKASQKPSCLMVFTAQACKTTSSLDMDGCLGPGWSHTSHASDVTQARLSIHVWPRDLWRVTVITPIPNNDKNHNS